MGNFTRVFRKMCFIVLCLALGSKAANATTYTAVVSGNFNTGLTWGGSAPGALVSTDTVIIPAGIVVTMTSNEAFSGTSSLNVLGTLTSGIYSSALTLTSGRLFGAGTIAVDSMALGLMSGFVFTGSIITTKLTSLGATIASATNITVSKLLNLASGTLTVGTGGTLTMGNLSTIEETGGTITTIGGGLLGLDSLYNVTYTTSALIGTELGGLGIDSIIINTPGTVTLAANTVINGTLSLASGTLALAGHTLTFGPVANLLATGTGTITGSTLSNIIVNTTGGLTGALRFATGLGSTLNNLVINTTTGVTTLGSNLNINNLLTMTTGALAIGANTLTLNPTGNIAGAGTLTGSTASNLVISTTGGLTNPLAFTAGSNMLNNLTLNTTTGGAAMASDLALSGLLTLTSGTLSLVGHTLTLNPTANVAATGAGTLTGSATSNLVANTTGSLTGALRFATGANTLNNLVVNTGAGTGLSLGSDLAINGMLTLTAGTLSLVGHTLTLNPTGNISAAGVGTITGSTLSNLVVNTTGGLTGALRFATGLGDSLNTLVINTTTGVTTLGSNLNINNLLTMTTGALAIGANTLTLNPAGNIAASGTGMLTGSTLSNLVINTAGGLTNPLTFTTGSNMLNNLTLNTATGGATMASDLALSGWLTLTSGTLSLNGHTLTMNPTADILPIGAGTLSGSATSNVVVNTTGSIAGALRFATGSDTLNNLVVNTGAGTVLSLGSDLGITGMLTLTAGTLSLAGNTLTLNPTGNLSATGLGTLTGSTLSNLVVNTTGGLTGALRFATGLGGTLNNLVINTITGVTTLGSDLNINNLLTMTSGALAIGANTLTLNPTGNIAASGIGTLSGSTLSNLVINTTGGLTSPLALGSNMLNNLTLNTGTGGATLSSDLSLSGLLTLATGTLSLNGHTLTLNPTADVSATGAGTLTGSATSNLVANTTGSLTGALRFAAGGNTLNNLVVNTGAGTGLSLGSGLGISGILTLTAGTLSLLANTLTLNPTGDVSAAGVGTITGSTLSSMVVNATNGLSGALRFATGAGTTLKNMVVNTATGGAALASNLNIDNLLTLTSGTLSLNGQTLTLNPNADLSAMSAGSLTGSTSSNVVVNSTFGLTSPLQFATGGKILHNLTANMGSSADNIMLGSNLTIQGALNLVSGKIKLGVNDLDIATGGTVGGGTENSYVVTDSIGSLIMTLATGANDSFKVGTVSNFAPIALLANAAATTGNVSVNVADGVLSNGTTGTLLSATHPLVNTTWFVSSTASTINYNMVAMWGTGMEVNGFDRTNAFISHFTGGAWDMQAPSASGTVGAMYSMTRTGITSLSPFMVRSGSAPLSVPVITAVSQKVSIYPNPTTNTLNYTTTGTISSIDISNLTGQVVKSANGLSQSVSVSELPTGTYFIHFNGTDVNTVLKFIKE